MRRQWVIAAGVTIVLLGGALGAGEAYARHRERTRATVPGTMPSMYYRHVRLRHALVNNYSYYGWVNTDSLGMRRTDDGHRPPGARPVILVLGSSTTFDTDVSGDLKAWPARLEARLRDKVGFQGRVLNGGVSGYTVVDHVIRLMTTLESLKPDLILLYEAHNDLFGTVAGASTSADTDEHRPGEVPAIAPWTSWLEHHSLLYAKIKGRLRAIRFGRSGGKRAERTAADWEQILSDGAARFERNLASLVAVARARGIPIVVMTVTNVSARDSVAQSDSVAYSWSHTLPGVPPAVTLDAYRRFNGRIAAVATRAGVPWIDGAASGVTGLSLYAEDDPIHFNDRGADQFAAFVADRITPFLPPSPSARASVTSH